MNKEDMMQDDSNSTAIIPREVQILVTEEDRTGQDILAMSDFFGGYVHLLTESFGLAFIGGSVGALVAMYVFHHKTKQDYFSVGVPLIILMQVVVLFFLMNGKI